MTRRTLRFTSGAMALLSRILLALCVAFLFTGRMEAAASHCAARAAANASQSEPAEPPCHATAGASLSGHHAAAPEPLGPDLTDAANPCDCIAMIKAFAERPAMALGSQEARFRWRAPASVIFASIVTDVERPPPRAA